MSSRWNPWSRSAATDRIFVSYRRTDATGYAGRLEDTLEAYFGEGRVFRDVGDIEPGEDFLAKIEESIQTTAALVVLIGSDWLVTDDSGKPRLHAPGDYVASEIGAALASDCLVVPVLVEGAKMPTEDELPEALKDLTWRNAVTVRDEHWRSDVTRLAKVLSFDVAGTVVERHVGALKVGALSLVALPTVFTLLTYVNMDAVAWNRYMMVVTPILLILVLLVLASTTSWLEQSRRKYIWAAVLLGFLGFAVAMILYLSAGLEVKSGAGDQAAAANEAQAGVAFTWTIVIGVGILAFLGMSGFKPNDQIA